MKFSRRFKLVLYGTLLTLYASGVVAWALTNWFKIDRGFGTENSPKFYVNLQIHSIVGLWFLVVFGYLLHSHVKRGWRMQKKTRSGVALIAPLLITMITVPGLFYLNDESIKSQVALIHTYFGLILPLPFFIHYFTKLTNRYVTSAGDRKPQRSA